MNLKKKLPVRDNFDILWDFIGDVFHRPFVWLLYHNDCLNQGQIWQNFYKCRQQGLRDKDAFRLRLLNSVLNSLV